MFLKVEDVSETAHPLLLSTTLCVSDNGQLIADR